MQNAGSIDLQGGSLLIAGGRKLDLRGGTLSGSGTVQGSVDSAATIHVGGTGTAGRLVVTGALLLKTGSSVFVELGGTTMGSSYDQLRCNGLVTLAGLLDVKLISSFAPKLNDAFDVASWATRSGSSSFGSINLPTLAGSLKLSPSYNTNELRLTTVPK